MKTFGHPAKILVPVETALADWTGAGHFQEKLDGCFALRAVEGGILAGEDVRGEFTAFDCVEADGQDVRGLPLEDRLRLRDSLAAFAGVDTVRTVLRDGAALLREVLARGGEGVVLKSPGSYYDPMIAAKREGVWTCRVVGHCGGKQSVFIVDAETGADRGKVTLRGGKCDQVRAGSIIRVEGMNLTESGKIRQPQPCREWLVSF